MKTLIVYRSLFGKTKRYAELMHKEIESDIEKYNRIDQESLSKYDMAILFAPTFAGWISLKGYLQKNWPILKDKSVILVVIGAAPEDTGWSKRSYNKIPEHIRSGIKYFKLTSNISSKKSDDLMLKYLTPIIEYIKSKDKG